jgi:hypothetical protein
MLTSPAFPQVAAGIAAESGSTDDDLVIAWI